MVMKKFHQLALYYQPDINNGDLYLSLVQQNLQKNDTFENMKEVLPAMQSDNLLTSTVLVGSDLWHVLKPQSHTGATIRHP